MSALGRKQPWTTDCSWPLAVVGEMAAPGQKPYERAITDGVVGKGSVTKPFHGTDSRGCCRSGCPMATRWRCLTETPR